MLFVSFHPGEFDTEKRFLVLMGRTLEEKQHHNLDIIDVLLEITKILHLSLEGPMILPDLLVWRPKYLIMRLARGLK